MEDSRPRLSGQARAPVLPDDDITADGRIGPTELKILGVGLAIAIIAFAIPLLRFVFFPIDILLHELGHTIVGWLMGYPSIPSFDFVYGGGLTRHAGFQAILALAVAGGFAYLAYTFRGNSRTLAIVVACFLVWLFFVSSEWRREIAFGAAGHIGECVFAGIFFYMALAGIGWRIPELERPLGAFIAFFIEFNMLSFCINLMHDQDFLEVYREGKGGMLMHDVDALSADLTIHTVWHPSIQALARLLLLFSFVPFAVAVLWYLKRARWHRVLRSLLTVTI